MMRKCLLLTFICTIFLMTIGCNEKEEIITTRPKLAVTNPLRKNSSIARDYVCQIKAIRRIELRALERGYIQSVFVDEGQVVKADQLMFEILPRLYQAELKKGEAEARFSKIEFQNTEKLANTNIVAPSELALAKAKLDKANASVAIAQTHVDFTQVKAPFEGIMGPFFVRQGSLVEEGQLLTTLSDNSEMWVYFNVPEAEYIHYRKDGAHDVGMKVKLVMADDSIYNYVGAVTAIEADFNNKTGNIAYRATFPNPERLLRHGQTGKIIVESKLENALLIPQKAVFDILDKSFVLVVDASGVVKSRQITLSARMPDIYVVGGGLSESDKILLEGQRKVVDGDLIEPVNQDPNEVFSKLKVYAE